jgi:asparagine synthase (glutamine-hydrolysing)
MCGIAGLMGARCPADARDRLDAALAHLRMRGPDASGRTRIPSGWMGATRLAMVGNQDEAVPIVLPGGHGVLVLNGEVYGDGEGAGWQTRTGPSDAVRLAERIARVGLRPALADLDADLALGLWSTTGGLFLARDRWGRRPLYYHWTPGLVAFASDLRALSLLRGTALDQDADQVAAFLRHRLLGPTGTLLQDVHGVAPGEVLGWTAAADRPPTRAVLDRRRAASTGDGSVRSLRRAVAAAGRSRLVDASPSLLLSGGVDSTLLAERVRPAVDELDLLTWTSPDGGDEHALAATTARRLGARLQAVAVDGRGFLETTVALARETGLPPVDPSEPVIALLATRATSRTILMGEGADELFGGYRYLHQQIAALERTAGPGPAATTQIEEAFLATRSTWSGDAVAALVHRDRAEGASARGTWSLAAPARGSHLVRPTAAADPAANRWTEWAARLTELYLAVHLPDLVLRADRAAMHASREARLPFLADEVTDLVLSANAERFERLVLGNRPAPGEVDDAVPVLGKAALRAAVEDHATSARPKVGFRLPVARWLRAQEPTVLAVVHAGCARGGVLDPDRSVDLVAADLARGDRSAGLRAFTLLAVAATTA